MSPAKKSKTKKTYRTSTTPRARRKTTIPRGPELDLARERVVKLWVNGEKRTLLVSSNKTLLEVLREDMALTGTKHGCELGECGACTVLVDGEPVLSCLVLPMETEGTEITTVEGIGERGEPHPLQSAFADLSAAQCGYCTPAVLLTAKSLLDQTPHPTTDLIKEALSGCLCRCTGYTKIIEAVELGAKRCARRSAQTEPG
jgi:aerobic-type carbon monoxide dehydrogenase small subunit (CoxS/CutS family)